MKSESNFLVLDDVNLKGKRVILRSDLNVPMKDGIVTSTARIEATLPTIKRILADGADQLFITSHLGRPKAGQFDEKYSLRPLVPLLAEGIGCDLDFSQNWLSAQEQKGLGRVVLCENTRFNEGEKENLPELARKMGDICDVYVNDAFATAHRAEASTNGIVSFAPISCAGLLLQKELEVLNRVLNNSKQPLVAVVGGAKVEGKLELLHSLVEKVDVLIVGGGIANTFLAASGLDVGKSLYEPHLIEEAKRVISLAASRGVALPLPNDCLVGKEFSSETTIAEISVDQVQEDDMILDIGQQTSNSYVELLSAAETILWNGPVGAFELEPFSRGTRAIGNAVAESTAYSVAGGGDTVAALDQFHLSSKINYISTGGGAFLEFLEGKTLPAVAALIQAKEVSRHNDSGKE